MDYISTMAKTEPATSGGQPQPVWVTRYGDGPIIISEVYHSGSASSAPLPDMDQLPTVSRVINADKQDS